MDSQNFGIPCKVEQHAKPSFISIFFLNFLDILKIGGPYTRLTFLNASSVNTINREFSDIRSVFRVIVIPIGRIFNDGVLKICIIMWI